MGAELSPSLPVPVIALGYAASSSLITIVNKYAITVFPYPAFLTMLQYFVSFVFVVAKGVFSGKSENDLGHKGWFSVDIFKRFFPAALVYYLAIFTNTKILLHANVETFITFRSSTPLLVAIADTLYYRKPWPSVPTLGSLVLILMGALVYMLTDSQFTVTAYSWAFAYLIVITFDMIYIKHVVSNIGLPTWGLVFYNNLTAFLISPPALYVCGEFRDVAQAAQQPNALMASVPVLLSCVFGVAISFFGFSCRQALSPTGFTVLGVVNKLSTVLINIFIWDKHASPVGVLGLLICIAGGVAYEQAGKLAKQAAAKQAIQAASSEKEEELPKSQDLEAASELSEKSRLLTPAGPEDSREDTEGQ